MRNRGLSMAFSPFFAMAEGRAGAPVTRENALRGEIPSPRQQDLEVFRYAARVMCRLGAVFLLSRRWAGHICVRRDLVSVQRGQTLQRSVAGPVPGISVPGLARLVRVPRASGRGERLVRSGSSGSGQGRRRSDRSGSARCAEAVAVDRSIGMRRRTAALRTRRAERETGVLLECPGTPWLWTGGRISAEVRGRSVRVREALDGGWKARAGSFVVPAPL